MSAVQARQLCRRGIDGRYTNPIYAGENRRSFLLGTFAGYRMHRHVPPNAVVAEGVLENKMPSHAGPGRSRGCGCRLTKGLHGHRLVILDVEDGI